MIRQEPLETTWKSLKLAIERMRILEDIQNRWDIELLVDEFYKQVIPDDLIGFIFTEVEALDLEKHIPIMYDFWETTVKANFKGVKADEAIQRATQIGALMKYKVQQNT